LAEADGRKERSEKWSEKRSEDEDEPRSLRNVVTEEAAPGDEEGRG
jgi:hypothetical protein